MKRIERGNRREQIKRLDKVFKSLDLKPEAVPCEAIKGILKEGDEVAEEFSGGVALDAGLIAAAQAVEHYEMARYGALRTWANELGLKEAASLLQDTLNEEGEADKLLTKLAEAELMKPRKWQSSSHRNWNSVRPAPAGGQFFGCGSG